MTDSKGVALCDDAVVQIGIAGLAKFYRESGYPSFAAEIEQGKAEHNSHVIAARIALGAAAAALSAGAGQPTDETGWLIELKGSLPRWWCIQGPEEPGWTRDASKALRFARKKDADDYIAEIGWTDCFASEHAWTMSKAPSPVAAGEAVEDDPPENWFGYRTYLREMAQQPAPPAEPAAGLVERLNDQVELCEIADSLEYWGEALKTLGQPEGAFALKQGAPALREAAARITALEAENARLRESLAATTKSWHELIDQKDAAEADRDRLREAPTFQARVAPWMQACFGPEISADKLERGDRFLEEALELLQSGDYPPERIAALVGYVYDRPAGEPNQEVGGVMVTLAAYCLAHGLDMHEAAETELARIWTKVDKIRAKQAAKPTGSVLPVAMLTRTEPDKGEA